MTACGQLPLGVFLHGRTPHGATPCSGLCANPVAFSVSDGNTYTSVNLGTSEGCFETTSEIVTGSCLSSLRPLTVNGKTMPCDALAWPVPLPTQRHHGYCIQVAPGLALPVTNFSAWSTNDGRASVLVRDARSKHVAELVR
jgi:hypothetical protein